jgi:hypothetical protein
LAVQIQRGVVIALVCCHRGRGRVNYRMVTPEIQQPPRGNILWVFRLP